MKAIGTRAKSHFLPVLCPWSAPKKPALRLAPFAIHPVPRQRRASTQPSLSFGHLAHLQSAPAAAAIEPDAHTARTLEELPRSEFAYSWDDLKFLCLSMVHTGYPRWGFVVYRCAYGDDDLWERYLAQLKESVREELSRHPRGKLLEKYLDWVVVENPQKLDGAPKAEVRRRFRRWVAGQVLQHDLGPLSVRNIARLNYCLYVDQKCLDTLERFQRSGEDPSMQGPAKLYRRPPMVVVVVERRWKPNQRGVSEEDRGYPPIEGCDERYVGWVYTRALNIASRYDDFSHESSLPDDPECYARPPKITRHGEESMPE